MNTIAIITAVFASSGFWAFLTAIITNRKKTKSAESRMLEGLGHDRICWLGQSYIERGYITQEEYENLHDYLYQPYRELGGNGTAKKIMDEVEKLPMERK